MQTTQLGNRQKMRKQNKVEEKMTRDDFYEIVDDYIRSIVYIDEDGNIAFGDISCDPADVLRDYDRIAYREIALDIADSEDIDIDELD